DHRPDSRAAREGHRLPDHRARSRRTGQSGRRDARSRPRVSAGIRTAADGARRPACAGGLSRGRRPMTTVLKVAGLRGGYTEVEILKGVDLALEEGRIVTVAGTNGAGKSTLAKAIVGLLPHVAGDIVVDGRSISAEPAERRAALGIGYVPQVANVFASL